LAGKEDVYAKRGKVFCQTSRNTLGLEAPKISPLMGRVYERGVERKSKGKMRQGGTGGLKTGKARFAPGKGGVVVSKGGVQ